MSEINYPTLLYPRGGETILTNEITITWIAPTVGNPIVYEIYYTEQYDPIREPDWKQIAVVGESVSQYVWRFGNGIRSDKCRIAIRARNKNGERSLMSVSPDNFSIHRKKLESPVIISPLYGERFDKSIAIITDDSGIVKTYSERSFYQFYYSSDSAKVPLTLIKQNVAIGSGPVVWETVNLPPARDYVIQAYLSDDDGNVSDSVFVKSLEIAHEGFFIVDTLPPTSAIVINAKSSDGEIENATFTKDRNVSIKVVSYDEATAVHSMQFIDGVTKSTPEPAADVSNFTLSSGDAVKYVEFLAQDYGANRNNQQTQRLFETFIEVIQPGHAPFTVSVADVAIDRSTSTAWFVTSFPYNNLYKFNKFPSLVMAFEDEPTSVAVFNAFPYVGVKTSNSTGILMKYNGYESTPIKTFTEADSIINAMTTHNGRLYIGFENGGIYSFDGITFRVIPGVSNPVKSLVSDGSLLYLSERNGTDVYIFNGTEFVSTGAE